MHDECLTVFPEYDTICLIPPAPSEDDSAGGPGLVSSRRLRYASTVSGMLAATFNILLTYPINKVMLRQQLYGQRVGGTVREMLGEGGVTLWRGVMPLLMQRTLTTGIMFGSYDRSLRYLAAAGVRENERRFTAGLVSGCAESVFAPFERVQAVLVVVNPTTGNATTSPPAHCPPHFRNTLHAFQSLYSTGGLRELYRGYSCILLRNSVMSALFFSLRPHVKRVFPYNPHSHKSVLLADFITGSLIGAFISTAFYPLAVAKMQMMSRSGCPHLSVLQAIRLAFDQRGQSLLRLYRGAHVNFPRSLLGWGIVNTVYEWSMSALFHVQTSL